MVENSPSSAQKMQSNLIGFFTSTALAYNFPKRNCLSSCGAGSVVPTLELPQVPRGHASPADPSLRPVRWAVSSGAPTRSCLDFGNWRIWQGLLLLSMAFSQRASRQLQGRIEWMFCSAHWRWYLCSKPITGVRNRKAGHCGLRGPKGQQQKQMAAGLSLLIKEEGWRSRFSFFGGGWRPGIP